MREEIERRIDSLTSKKCIHAFPEILYFTMPNDTEKTRFHKLYSILWNVINLSSTGGCYEKRTSSHLLSPAHPVAFSKF